MKTNNKTAAALPQCRNLRPLHAQTLAGFHRAVSGSVVNSDLQQFMPMELHERDPGLLFLVLVELRDHRL